jgi:excisionase family DNA binding protein
MNEPAEDQILGLRDVARRLGLAYRRTLQLAKQGKIPVWRPGGEGGEYRAYASEIEKYREAQRVQPKDPAPR